MKTPPQAEENALKSTDHENRHCHFEFTTKLVAQKVKITKRT